MLKVPALFFFLLLFTTAFSQNTILWKITNTNTEHTSYLLGTNHLFGESFVDSFPVIREKIQASDMVITETAMNRKNIDSIYKDKPESDSAYMVLSQDDATLMNDIFKKNVSYIKRLTPGELYLKLQIACIYSICSVINKNNQYKMDEYIQLLGKKNNKQLYYFETDTFQLHLLDTGTNYYTWSFFKRNAPIVLNWFRHPNNLLCWQINQYASLKMEYKFNSACNFIESKAISNDAFIKERNENWLRQLPSLLQQNNCFIAVGFGHLCNQCGLVKQLQQMGYTVDPVEMKAAK
ncbi:MAG: TraB/GumN family protein [Bacteroidetes bacterium]|nr:TraB/GumN family protein [Bacteroidota bacterium]